MKFNVTMIQVESVNKVEKVLKSVKTNFFDNLSIVLDSAIYEIDADQRTQVEIALSDLLNDAFNEFRIKYARTMAKAGELIETSLNK